MCWFTAELTNILETNKSKNVNTITYCSTYYYYKCLCKYTAYIDYGKMIPKQKQFQLKKKYKYLYKDKSVLCIFHFLAKLKVCPSTAVRPDARTTFTKLYY